MIRVLLVCGAGMSSGFLANNSRKYAKKNKIDMKIDARSTSEVASYAGQIDVLLVGQNYKGEIPAFEKILENYNVPIGIIPGQVYSTLDGRGIVEQALGLIEGDAHE